MCTKKNDRCKSFPASSFWSYKTHIFLPRLGYNTSYLGLVREQGESLRLKAFPDRRLEADNVVWSKDGDTFYSSHLLFG